MRAFGRVVLWVVAAVAVLLAAFAVTIYDLSAHRLHRHYSVAVAAVPPRTGAGAIAEGEHVATIRGCTACHGTDGGGAKVMDDPAMGRVYAPNLTSGAGGLAPLLTDADWVRAVRHGVAHDGHPLLIMPSRDYVALSDADLGAILAFFHSLPPVDRTVPAISPGPVMRILLAFGKMRLAADIIDQGASPPVAPVPAGPTAQYGRYLAATCTGCHNPHFSGGKIVEGPPDWPPAANLTGGPGSATKGWTEADFIRTLRTMRAPDGRAVNPVMPAVFGQMSDVELQALWAYLQTLPPAPTG